MSADSVPSSKTNMFQSKLYTLIYCRHFRTYSRCAMFDWSDTVFRRSNVTRRRISNTVLQPRYWGSEADSPEVCRLSRGIEEAKRIHPRFADWRIYIYTSYFPYEGQNGTRNAQMVYERNQWLMVVFNIIIRYKKIRY